MLKVRVIPTLLWKDFGLVKGVSFDSWRRIGSVLPAVKVYNQREVDELILLDISAHKHDNSRPDFNSIGQFGAHCFIPFTVGGGICRLEDARDLFRAGADKVCINTSAYRNPNLINQIASHFGSQSLVVSIDVRFDGLNWQCYSNAGQILVGKTVIDWVGEVADRGAGEILVTSIDQDGMMQGYDLKLIDKVVSAVNIPVIASGGAGNYDHMVDAILKSGASAVAAASMFHFTEQTPLGAKKALSTAGIPVRLSGLSD